MGDNGAGEFYWRFCASAVTDFEPAGSETGAPGITEIER